MTEAFATSRAELRDAPIPVFGDKYARGWPVHANARPEDVASYTALPVALTRAYSTDAHFTAYSVPQINRRLASEDVFAALEGGAAMVLFVGDVDWPGKDDPEWTGPSLEDWWRSERVKLDALLAVYPGAFVYRTGGGYRFVYWLASPFVIASARDKEQWSASYLAWRGLIKARFEIVIDRACHDWTRFYRLPHVVRKGKRQTFETLGDPNAIGTWPEPFAPPPAEPAPRPRSNYTPRPGDFDIYDFMAAVEPGAGRYQQQGRPCWDVECPNEDQHSSKTKRDSVVTFGPDGPTFHCFHEHCEHLHWKDYRRHHDPSYVPWDERPPWVKSYEPPRPRDLRADHVERRHDDEQREAAPADFWEGIPGMDDTVNRDAKPPPGPDVPPPDGTEPTSGPHPNEPGEDDGGSYRSQARGYITRHGRHGGVLKLRRWRNDWYEWIPKRGSYYAQTEERVGANLYRDLHLDEKKEVSEIKTALLAEAGVLIDEYELGSWLDRDPDDEDLDARYDIAACRNGLLHLPTGKLTPATPRYFSTSSLGVDYDPRAPMPRLWHEFLTQLWPGDEDSIAALQEWMGYLLTPDTRQHKIAITVGPRRCGKGTISRVTSALLGGKQNVASPTLASLATNFGLWPLIGKSSAVIPDARLGVRSDLAVQVVEVLLSISGEDSKTIDRKHREPWTGTLPTRFTLFTNEVPRFHDASDALPGRMLAFEIKESFWGREDTALTGKLLKELPGILLWAIEGWRRLRARGRFLQPASGQDVIDTMLAMSSPVGAWLHERCDIKFDDSEARWWLTPDDAFVNYKTWCDKNEQPKPTMQRFGRDLKAANHRLARELITRDGERIRVYKGLLLKSDWKPGGQ